MKLLFLHSIIAIFIVRFLCSASHHALHQGSTIRIESTAIFFRDSNKSASCWLQQRKSQFYSRNSLLQYRATTTRGGAVSTSAPKRRSLFLSSSLPEKYHLIYSTGVPLQIALWTLLFTSFRLLRKNKYYHASTTTTILLPIFSSACCAVQLALNMLFTGMGCAGFNKVFGPLRPIFLSILLHWTWDILFRAFNKPFLLLTILSSWALALLPEITHYLNTRKNAIKTTTIGTNDNSQMVEILLSVPSMGCVACINKVTSSLKKYNDDNKLDLLTNEWKKKDTQSSGSCNATKLNTLNNTTPTLHSFSSWLVDEGNEEIMPKSNNRKSSGGIARILVAIPSTSNYYNMTFLGERLSNAVRASGFRDCTVASINEI